MQFENEEVMKVHLKLFKRCCRDHNITIAYGFPDRFDLKKIAKELRRTLSCTVTFKKKIYIERLKHNRRSVYKVKKETGEEEKSVIGIKIEGDKRKEVKDFLVKKKIIESNNIIIHGF